MAAPDFVIAGAMRAGTTALASALGEHPDVFMCTPKEPSFFAAPHGSLDFRGPADQLFANDNVTDWSSYQALFRDAGTRLRGEASALYLTLPGVPQEIRDRCPDARIVLILRDPVERAYSAWQYLRGTGREDRRDFAAGLAAEPARRARGYNPIWWYVGASRYHVGLEEFLTAFPRSQVHVLTTEALRRDPLGAMAGVHAFLGLTRTDTPPSALGREVNRSGVPRVEALSRLLYPSHRIRVRVSRIAPPAVRALVRRARAASLRPGGQMSPEVRRRLQDELAEVGPEVTRLTGVDTSHWQTGEPGTDRQPVTGGDDAPSGRSLSG